MDLINNAITTLSKIFENLYAFIERNEVVLVFFYAAIVFIGISIFVKGLKGGGDNE